MSKGNKKLWAAVASAILESEAVQRDTRNDSGNGSHASAEAVFEGGRKALAQNGLVLIPVGFEHHSQGNRAFVTRIVKLCHTSSGKFELLKSPPWPFVPHKLTPAQEMGGLTTRTLRYMVRDLLLLPASEYVGEEFTEDDEATLERLLDKEKAVGMEMERSTPRHEKPERTEEEVMAEIDQLLLSETEAVSVAVCRDIEGGVPSVDVCAALHRNEYAIFDKAEGPGARAGAFGAEQLNVPTAGGSADTPLPDAPAVVGDPLGARDREAEAEEMSGFEFAMNQTEVQSCPEPAEEGSGGALVTPPAPDPDGKVSMEESSKALSKDDEF